MTEPSATPAAPPRPFPALALLALVVALAALAMTCPAVQEQMPWHTVTSTAPAPVDLAPLEKNIAALNARLDTANEKIAALENTQPPAAPEIPADIASRLTALEQKSQSNDAALNAQAATLQQAQQLPVALAWLRVEERFERGQDFTAALALAQQLQGTPAATAITAAAHGLPTANALLQTLGESERALRRADRLAGVDNPLDRIWAELQSLILIKHLNEEANDTIGRALAGLRAAVQADDAAALQTVWAQLSPAAQQYLTAWKATVDQRLAVRAALDTIIGGALGH